MKPRCRVVEVVAFAILASFFRAGTLQLMTGTQDYAVLVERSSNRKYFNSYGLGDNNVGRGNSTLLRLKAWQGLSQASFEWSIFKLRSSGPIITSKYFAAGGVVWTLWLDLQLNSSRVAAQQGGDTVGVMLAASWATAWAAGESVTVSVRVALPKANWSLLSSIYTASAVLPDVAASLTRHASGLWIATLERSLLERGLLGGGDGDECMIRIHLLNVTVHWQEGKHVEASYSRAVGQQVSVMLSAESYSVREEFNTAVRTSVVDGGGGDGVGADGDEAQSQYEWGGMRYNSSLVGELMWYFVLANLRCHGLSDEDAHRKIDAVVGMCDIISGRIVSHPRVRVVADGTAGVRYLDEHGEDLRKYGLPCRSSYAVTDAAESDMVQAGRHIGAAGYGSYSGVHGYGSYSDVVSGGGVHDGGWHAGWVTEANPPVYDPWVPKGRGRRQGILASAAATIFGILLGGSGGDGSSSSGDNTGSSTAAAIGGLERPDSEGNSDFDDRNNYHRLYHQQQGETLPGRYKSLMDVLPWNMAGGGGAATSLLSDLLYGYFGGLLDPSSLPPPPRPSQLQQHLQQQEKQQLYENYVGSDEEMDCDDDMVWDVMAVLSWATPLAVALVLMLLIRGKPLRLLLRIVTLVSRSLRRRGMRRDRVRRDHAPASLVGAKAAAAAAAVPAVPSQYGSGGVSSGAGGAGKGSRSRIAVAAGAEKIAAGAIHRFHLSRQQTRSRRNVNNIRSSSSVAGANGDRDGHCNGSCNSVSSSLATPATKPLPDPPGGSPSPSSASPACGLVKKPAPSSQSQSPAPPPPPPLLSSQSAAVARSGKRGTREIPPCLRMSSGGGGGGGSSSDLLWRLSSLPLPLLAALVRWGPWQRGATKGVRRGDVPQRSTAAAAAVRNKVNTRAAAAAARVWSPETTIRASATATSQGPPQQPSLGLCSFTAGAVHPQHLLQQPQQAAADTRALCCPGPQQPAAAASPQPRRQRQRRPGLFFRQALPALLSMRPTKPQPPLDSTAVSSEAAMAAVAAAKLPPMAPTQNAMQASMGGTVTTPIGMATAAATGAMGMSATAATTAARADAVAGEHVPVPFCSHAHEPCNYSVPGSGFAGAAAATAAAAAAAAGATSASPATAPMPSPRRAASKGPLSVVSSLSGSAKRTARFHSGNSSPRPPMLPQPADPHQRRLAARSSRGLSTHGSDPGHSAAARCIHGDWVGAAAASAAEEVDCSSRCDIGECSSRDVEASEALTTATAAATAVSGDTDSFSWDSSTGLFYTPRLSSVASIGGSSSGNPPLDLPALATSASLSVTVSTPISSVSGGCGTHRDCDVLRGCGSGSSCGGASAIAAPPPPPQQRPVQKQPWSLALLAEMAAGDTARRRRQYDPSSPHDFACLACLDAPRQHGFLHGSTVHLGLCGECASRLAAPSAAGALALACLVCRQPVERMVDVVL